MRPGKAAVAGVGVAVVVALFWLFRIRLTGTESRLLTSDLLLYYLPVYQTLYGQLAHGTLPLWNPYQLCGIPRLASLQAGFFYPGHVLYLLLPVGAALGVSGVAHLVLVALSMAVLVRRLGLCIGAAVAAAVVVAIRGRYPGMIFFPNMLEAAAWLPLGAIAVVGIAGARESGRPLRFAALLGLCTGCSLLAGYPQVSVYVVYGQAALLAALLVARGSDAKGWLSAGSLFAIGIALGAALAAVQLLPGWELTAAGTRSPGPLTRWQQFPFGWKGSGFLDGLAPALKAPFPVLPLSFGWGVLAALVAGAAALFAGRSIERRHRLLFVACLATAALVLLFAMGPLTPAFDVLVELPALGWFRFPRRSLFLVDFFVAIAVSVSVHALIRLGFSLRARPGAALVATSMWASSAALIPALALSAEYFAAEPNRESLTAGPAAMDVYSEPREIFTRVAESGERVWLRSLGLAPELPPKLATYFGMRSVGDYEPLNLRRQSEYFTWLMEGRLSPAREGRPFSGQLKHLTAPTYPSALSQRGHLLDVAAVTWLVVSKLDADRGELGEFVRAHGLLAESTPDPSLVLLRNPWASPRAFTVYEIREAPEPAALMAAMSDPSFDPLVASFAEGPSRARPAGAPARGAPARIVRDDDTRVEIEARLEAPGMLVLVDSFYPGWRATVDGRELEIVAVNHLFRGVPLEAGTHLVRFEYEPWTVPAGAAVSGLSALAILVLVRGRRPSAAELPAPRAGDSIRDAGTLRADDGSRGR